MRVGDAFDQWAAEGRDRGMESRHWHTARQALREMPVEAGDVVLDLGSGSGYAARALRRRGADRAYGVDRSLEMAANARAYTDDDGVSFLRGDFAHLPFPDAAIDHAFSMEAFYYAADPPAVLDEVRRVLRSGGTFYCAVDYYAENEYAHGWEEATGLDLTLWSRAEYRAALRDAGFAVAAQRQLADRETDIPPEPCFPYRSGESTVFETRDEMVERYRDLGTLLTVGVAPAGP
ncbi:MAG: class I SAM-dependent methyltransferase [Halobacteriaceae archaeon]